MPIEIKELHIKAVIAGKDRDKKSDNTSPVDIAQLKKEIMKEVTDKINRILKQKNER